MGTTAKPIDLFALGLRDTTGAVVASAKLRFYQPGTLVSQTVYSDSTCSTPYSQPITCNAAGQATVYALEPVRCIAKDTTETTTYYDGICNLQRHDAVYITSTSINSGVETTLENLLSTMTTSLGTNFQYKESSTATARYYVDVIGDMVVSVKDFGATGDGTTDDRATIQSAIDRVAARGGGVVFFPKGTYKILAALTSATAAVSFRGVGRGASVISNAGTTTNALTIDLGSALESKVFVEDLGFTCATTSSGAAVSVLNGERPIIRRCSFALHRTGVEVSAVTQAYIEDCYVASTDDNAAAIGINLGARASATQCEVVSGTTNGTGVKLASTDGRVTDCFATKFAIGIHANGARGVIRGGAVASATTGVTLAATDCRYHGGYITTATTGVSVTSTTCVVDATFITGATTGVSSSGAGFTLNNSNVAAGTTCVSLTGARSRILGGTLSGATTGASLGVADCVVSGTTLSACTTGVSVGAFASCSVTNCSATGCTTDLSVNTAATLFNEHNNNFTTTTFNQATAGKIPRRSADVTVLTDSTSTASITPVAGNGKFFQVFVGSYTAGAQAVTINATATTNLAIGDELFIKLIKSGANVMNATWNTQYQTYSNIATMSATFGAGVCSANNERGFWFRWNGSNWILINSEVGHAA